MKKRLICSVLVALMLLSVGCGTLPVEPKRQTRVIYQYFNTVTTVYSYLGDTAEVFAANCDAVEELLAECHRLYDIYYEYSGVNNICTVNKNAGQGPVVVDEKIIDLLEYAKEVHRMTGGKTNVAMGSVLRLWHECREAADNGAARLPDEALLEEAAQHTDIDCLVIDREGSTVELTDSEMSLDVGAIAKGYTADLIRDLLISRGVDSYLLNVGGNIVAIGARTTGEPWVAGITNPDPESDDFPARVALKSTACVTSGNYERYYTVDGVRYHHLIDPKTQKPARFHSSVTVICPDSALGDALSTALFCMSREDGEGLIADLPEVEVMWISDGTYEVYMTEGFAALTAE